MAAIVVWVSLKLGKKSLDDLFDRIPDDLRDKVAHAAGQVGGVESVTKVRMRRAGSEVFADITLSVGHTISFERAHEIADEAAEAVARSCPAPTWWSTPSRWPEQPRYHHAGSILAARRGLGAHGIRLYAENLQRWLELHLEVPDRSRSTRPIARPRCSRMTAATVQGLMRIVSHLEPVGDAIATVEAEPVERRKYRRPRRIPSRRCACCSTHNVKAQRADGEIQVSFHCRVDPQTLTARPTI